MIGEDAITQHWHSHIRTHTLSSGGHHISALFGRLLLLRWRRLQLLNLLDEIRLLVVELFILGAVRVKVQQKFHEFVLVFDEYVEDGLRLVRVGDKHFEHVERLELDVARLVAEEIHHQLQVVLRRDVLSHDHEVVRVQQQLPEQLQRLPFRHVVLRVEEDAVLGENFVVVLAEELRAQKFVSREELLECAERVRGDVERGQLNVTEQIVELLPEEHDACQRLVAKTLAKNHTAVERHLGLLVTLQQDEKDFALSDEKIHRRETRPDLATQQNPKDLDDLFLRLEIQPRQMFHEHREHVGIVVGLRKLRHELSMWILIPSSVEDVLTRLQLFRDVFHGFVGLLTARSILLEDYERVDETLGNLLGTFLRGPEQRHDVVTSMRGGLL